MHRTTDSGLKRILLLILTLCVAYALVGLLALSLAIPPGYATAIFPSAGIAVAALLIWGYRLWPGIFLGSLFLNVWISISQGAFDFSALSVATAVAIGACLQALLGAWLIRRFVGFPSSLAQAGKITKFMILAGPVSCLINSSIGTSSLMMSSVISSDVFAYSWFTWWVGDTIGVLMAVPFMFAFFAEPKALWRSRRTSVAIPLTVMLMLVIGIFIWVSKLESARIKIEFSQIAMDVFNRLETSFTSYTDSVLYIERLFAASSHVSRSDFREFVSFILDNKPGVQGLSWNPNIQHADRLKFENSVRSEGFNNFTITERNANGELIPAKVRESYVAVNYIEPMANNEKALGFDVFSQQARREAIIKARDTGLPVATASIKLVQEKGTQAGFLLFNPIFAGSHKTVEQRKANLAGYAVGVFRVGDIIDAVVKEKNKKSFILAVEDITDTANGSLLYGNALLKNDQAVFVQWTSTIDIGGRLWRITFNPSADFLSQQRGWQAWAVLAAGLLFTSLLGVFLLTISGRSHEVEALVKQRTSELSGILSTAIETIITVNERGEIQSINPAGQSLLGVEASKVIGKNIEALIPEFFTGKDDLRSYENLKVTDERRDTVILLGDHSEVPIELAISTLRLQDKTLYTAIIHDLTERTKINRLKDEFIATVSHELRTPLTSVKGSLGLLKGGVLGEFSDKAAEMILICYQNIERLELLINDILDINKLELSDLHLTVETFPVNSLIQKVLDATQGYADKYGVSYQWQPDKATNVLLNADQNKLIQVLTNLISNAVKYSPRGKSVQLTTTIIDKMMRIAVTDQGPGIPLEFQDKIFDKFSQADSTDTRRVGGTGLGLAIAKAIVEKHSGKIGFESNPGAGTTFYFDLPIK